MLRIKDLREDRDLLQKDIADYLNISQTNYSKYELGKVNIPISTLEKLALYFNTSIDYLLGLTNVQTPYERISNSKNTEKSSHILTINTQNFSREDTETLKKFIEFIKWKNK